MPDRFAAQVERFLLDRMDDLTEICDAHASAQHATSWGRDAPAVHERDALVQQLADDIAALTTTSDRRAAA